MGEGRGGKAKLPLLKEGNRNLLTGTYLAEQISSVSYDLVSANAAQCRTHVGRAGAISPGSHESSPSSPRDITRRGRKKASNWKWTELPALENIDTLFKEREDEADALVDEMEAWGSTNLGKIVESAEREDEDDADFKEWLTLPKNGESPREGADCPTWHLLLSHKTFSNHAEPHIAAALMQVLKMDPHIAYDRALELRKRRLLLLDKYSDKRDAFRMLQKLRGLGLQVQVTIDSGLPGNGRLLEKKKSRASAQLKIGERSRKPAQDRSYTELFFRAGAKLGLDPDVQKVSRWVSSGPQVSKQNVGLERWRSMQACDFEQIIFPEDPVKALFLAEKAHEEPHGAALFRKVVSRHTTDIHSMHQQQMEDQTRNLARIMEGSLKKIPGKDRPTFADSVFNALKAKDELSQTPAGGEATSSTNVTEASKPKEITAARKEACLLMRFFVFGKFGYEDSKDKDRDSIFQENMGTRPQVMQLHRLWSKMDGDLSGRVDLGEWRGFIAAHISEVVKKQGRPPDQHRVVAPRDPKKKRGTMYTYHHVSTVTMNTQLQISSANELLTQAVEDTAKFTAVMCEKLSNALLGKKSSFSVEDIMRLIWLHATAQDTKNMKQWCREYVEDAIRNRVETPPVLDDVEYQGLCAVFVYFDDERQGQILFDSLVTKGLIYTEQVDEYRMLWDSDGNGLLSLDEFCDMMCPVGFRATAQSEIGSQADGKRVIYDKCIKSWKLENLPDEPLDEFGKEPPGKEVAAHLKELADKELAGKEAAGKEVAGHGQEAPTDDFLQ